jgi:hypothetical protein
MTSRKEKTRHAAEVEAREIQLAIEVLNRYGFEHHIANHILQVERDNRWALIQRITDELAS